MSLYDFQILGSLVAGDAVVGSLSTSAKKGRDRTVLIVLTEGLSDHKRREKIQCAKSELGAGGLVTFPDAAGDRLKDAFTCVAENDVKAPLQSPDFIRQTLDLLMDETNSPLIVLDAQSRDCFWGALREMGAQSADLFAVAELGALQPEAKSKRVSKPIGEAHRLCGDLHGRNYDFADYSTRDLINKIRRSQKIKLPDINIKEQVIGSYFLRELERNLNTEKSKIVSVGNFLGRLRSKFMRSRPDEGNVLFSKGVVSVETINRFAQKHAEANDIDASYAKQAREFLYCTVVSGDPYEELRKVFIDFHDFDPDTFDFDSLTRKYDKVGFEQLQFRAGIHVSPYDLALFETDIKDSEGNHVFTFGSLVDKDDFGMTIYNFFRNTGGETLYVPHTHKMCVRFDTENQASNLAIIDMETDRLLTSGTSAGIEGLADMVFAHTLSGIARMNEPGFAPVTYQTHGRGYADIKKGRYPYFDYIGVESFGIASSHVRVSSKGNLEPTESVMRRHVVRGHPRRHRDTNGDIRKITMVPMHLRGDERLGFVTNARTLDK